jgi:hypothetical protein
VTPDPVPRRLFEGVRGAIRDRAPQTRPPRLDVRVTVPTPGGRVTDEAQATATAAAHSTVGSIAADLGVPVRPACEVVPDVSGAGLPRLEVEGCLVRVPAEQFEESLRVHLGYPRRTPGSERDGRAWGAIVSVATRVALAHDPSVLVGERQRRSLVARTRGAGVTDHTDQTIVEALERVVANGVCVGDLAPLREAWRRATPDVEDLAERAIDALAPDAVQVRLPESTLRRMTADLDEPAVFVDLRLRLFADLGLTVPDIDIVADDSLRENTCVVRLNHVELAPRPVRTVQLTEVAAVLEAAVREHASWFVSRSEVERITDELRLALPELVGAVQERYEISQLSALARTLVEERVPVRNAGRLMVLLLDATPPGRDRDMVRLADPTRPTDDESVDLAGARQLVSYARQQINEELARGRAGEVVRKVTRVPYGLEDRVDACAVTGDPLPADVVAELLALAARQAALAEDARTLVTGSQQSRAAVRAMLARQYPDIPVWAVEEFPAAWPVEGLVARRAGSAPSGRTPP